MKRIVRKRALERWETKAANCKVTSQAVLLNAKSLTTRNGPKAPSAIHVHLDAVIYPIDKSNITTGCFENKCRTPAFVTVTTDDLKDQVEALLATVKEDSPDNFRPCDVSKEIHSLNL
jgi:hypothetical protein